MKIFSFDYTKNIRICIKQSQLNLLKLIKKIILLTSGNHHKEKKQLKIPKKTTFNNLFRAKYKLFFFVLKRNNY